MCQTGRQAATEAAKAEDEAATRIAANLGLPTTTTATLHHQAAAAPLQKRSVDFILTMET